MKSETTNKEPVYSELNSITNDVANQVATKNKSKGIYNTF